MHDADPAQQRHAPVVEAPDVGRPLPAGREQQETGPELHREDREELAVGQDRGREPDPPVRPAEVAAHGGVEPGGHHHRERLDVDRQDAEDADAAEGVERGDARGVLRHRGGPLRGAGDDHGLGPAPRRRVREGVLDAREREPAADQALHPERG